MSNATALKRATAYPAYDPAGAVRAYVDEFGALELAGWTALGIGLALTVRFAPKLASPTATHALPEPMRAALPAPSALVALPAPDTLPVLAAPAEPLALEPAAPADPVARTAEPTPAPEGRQMIVTRKEP